ncbi:MAG: hypothetical protein IT320_22405 [Anaerolineae bacterium]|nr:hypothetical protein [Anaerolineae bacterium]
MSGSGIRVDNEHFSANYDFDDRILRVRYKGQLTPALSTHFYQWLIGALKDNPHLITEARGSIYDFRDVSEVANANMSSSQRQSQQVNQQVDLQNHPVALIAKDSVQRALLTATMRISPQHDRKRVVGSEAEAIAYIESFHKQQERQPE